MGKDQSKKSDRLAIRHSLGSRFSLHIFLVLIIVNVCSLFYIYTVEDKRNLKDLREQGGVIGKYIATSVSPHLLNYDFISLDDTLSEAMHLQGIHYTAILASNEVYVAARISPAYLRTLQKTGTSASPAHQDQFSMVQTMREKTIDHIDISTPIIFADNYLGRVVIGLSLEISRQKTKAFLTILLVVNGVVALLLAAGIYFVFWKKTLQPIYQLIDGANRVANGNFNVPVPLADRDEIGMLTDSFNSMMAARKKAEEEILKSRKDWERLFNAVEDLVTIQDNNMYILQANTATNRLLGTEQEELVGKPCYEVLQGRSEPCPGCPAVLGLQDHKYHHADMEYPQLGKTLHLSSFPVHDDKKGWVGIANIARDITEQKKLEAQYRQVQKMEAIGTLAGGIAHDFNNILTPIFGYAQLIQLEAESGSQLEENIDQILHSSELAKDLVQQILTFSRERQHEMQQLRITPIIKESMKLLRASIPSTIEFKLELDENCGNILADPTQIHQVIMNICTNAYHAMEQSGGILAVTLRQTILDDFSARMKGNLAAGDYVELRISDTGSGMDQTIRERIFEPFFTTKEEGKGTGMGLSVVHGIVKEHGGAVFAYSEPGAGSTFTVYLPVVFDDAASASPLLYSPVQDKVLGGEEHILILDDEPSIIDLEQRFLEKVGYQVTGFTVARQALEAFLKNPHAFDLVITDMTMPELSGLDFANQVVAVRPDLPVILCTGHSRISIAELEDSPAITSFLAKPINLGQLTKAVREGLDNTKK